MVQSAFVYRVGPYGPEYLGKQELDLPLRAEETNSYIHRRERHVVRVDRIEPAGWEPQSDVLPTVYVSTTAVKQRSERELMPRRRKKSAPWNTEGSPCTSNWKPGSRLRSPSRTRTA
jgi:hypothetical protein